MFVLEFIQAIKKDTNYVIIMWAMGHGGIYFCGITSVPVRV